jgi:hypothetical protein
MIVHEQIIYIVVIIIYQIYDKIFNIEQKII